jgi:hypothetical protein
MITFIIPPPQSSTRNNPIPPAQTVEDGFQYIDIVDERILHLLRDKTEPIGIWKLINAVASLDNPKCRAARDRFRLHVWEHLRLLIKSGVVRRLQRRLVLLRSVELPPRFCAGSTLRHIVGPKLSRQKTTRMPVKEHVQQAVVLENQKRITAEVPHGAASQLEGGRPEMQCCEPNIQDGVRYGLDGRTAGKELAASRWQFSARRTGRVRGRRRSTGQAVVLANGEVGRLRWAYRKKVLVEVGPPSEVEACQLIASTEDKLELAKNPYAQSLGALKKGAKERRSREKVRSCRKNATMPAGPGSRRRGRPRKSNNPHCIAPNATSEESLRKVTPDG